MSEIREILQHIPDANTHREELLNNFFEKFPNRIQELKDDPQKFFSKYMGFSYFESKINTTTKTAIMAVSWADAKGFSYEQEFTSSKKVGNGILREEGLIMLLAKSIALSEKIGMARLIGYFDTPSNDEQRLV